MWAMYGSSNTLKIPLRSGGRPDRSLGPSPAWTRGPNRAQPPLGDKPTVAALPLPSPVHFPPRGPSRRLLGVWGALRTNKFRRFHAILRKRGRAPRRAHDHGPSSPSLHPDSILAWQIRRGYGGILRPHMYKSALNCVRQEKCLRSPIGPLTDIDHPGARLNRLVPWQ